MFTHQDLPSFFQWWRLGYLVSYLTELLIYSRLIPLSVDTTRPAYDPLAIKLHQLASASLTLARPMEEPSVLLLQTIIIYLYALQLTDTRISTNRFWVLSGMAFRMVVAVSVIFSMDAVFLTLIHSWAFIVMFLVVAWVNRSFTPGAYYFGNAICWCGCNPSPSTIANFL